MPPVETHISRTPIREIITAIANQLHQRFGGVVITLLFSASSAAAVADDWRFTDVQRVVAISDVHGAYEAMVSTLRSAAVVDAHNDWSGGKSHLVITGDLLDRGPDSRRVMDLIIRLERDAARAGGRVHLLLGNHEVMNLVGDTRYVSMGEYAAFSDDESVEEREFWFDHFRRARASSAGLSNADERSLRAVFDKIAPPGFFAHRRAFGINGEYGMWLIEKPLMIGIDDTAFVHGGFSALVAEEGLEGVNRKLKTHLVDYMMTLSKLEQNGVLSPIDGFREHPAILTAELNSGRLSPALTDLAEAALALHTSPLHGADGPLWYRGTATCSGLVEGDVLNSALEKTSAIRAVIGHTTTETRQIQQRLNGRVIEINTGMLKSTYRGSGYALIIEDGALSVASEDGDSGLRPVTPPRRIGDRPKHLDDADVSRILAHGAVLDTISSGSPRSIVRVGSENETLLAYFDRLAPNGESMPELAAYRLDRLLGLDMIPTTVRREVSGLKGTLQLASPGAMTEFERVASHQGDRQPCLVEKQLRTMRVFDALIGNTARTPNSMLYVDDRWRLMLVDHRSAFGRSSDPTAGASLAIGSEWRSALAKLDDGQLREQLGDVLSERQLIALTERRDALIERLRAGP